MKSPSDALPPFVFSRVHSLVRAVYETFGAALHGTVWVAVSVAGAATLCESSSPFAHSDISTSISTLAASL